MCCSVLQCNAVCCNVVQGVAACCSVLHCVAACCSVLIRVAVCCSVLQRGAICCSVLQCVAVCCSVLQCVAASCRIYVDYMDESCNTCLCTHTHTLTRTHLCESVDAVWRRAPEYNTTVTHITHITWTNYCLTSMRLLVQYAFAPQMTHINCIAHVTLHYSYYLPDSNYLALLAYSQY